MATKSEKIKIAEEFSKKLATAKAVVLTDYRGLTHHQLEDLRKALKAVKAEYKVIKNTLLKKTLTHSNFQLPASNFEIDGPTAALVSYEDEVSALQALSKFMQSTNLPTVKLGFLFGQQYSSDDVIRISKLPTKSTLIAQLVAYTKAPLYGLHNALSWNTRKLVYALEGVKSKKS